MNTVDNDAKQRQVRNFRPKFSLYHANLKCTGCAVKMELHPATGEKDGFIMASLANQLTVGNMRGERPTYSTFDWNNAIHVKLDFSDLTKMLEVFRGITESICDGKGLFHTSQSGTTKIALKHCVGVESGYSLDVYRSKGGSDASSSAHITLTSNEAYGLALAIEDSLGAICFGVPSAWCAEASRNFGDKGTADVFVA